MEKAQILPHIGELGRVVEHQNCASYAGHPLSGSTKVSAENVGLAHSLIVKEAIGSLGVGPVLARQGNALTGRFGKLLQDGLEAFTQPAVSKLATQHFILHPRSVTVGMGINQWQL
jgi:hypothetical protein